MRLSEDVRDGEGAQNRTQVTSGGGTVAQSGSVRTEKGSVGGRDAVPGLAI